MEVHRQEIIRPDGKQKPYWVLNRSGDFSVIVPVFPDMTTTLVGQYRVPIRKYLWEFPMGTVKGANPLATAKEELRQETGLTAASWRKVGHIYVAAGFSGQRAHIFTASGLTEGIAEPEEDEYIDTKRIKLQEVRRMMREGIMIDGPSIIAFHLLLERSGLNI